MKNEFSFQELRERAGLSRDEVAELVGCDLRSVYRWERGEVEPRKAVTLLLAERAESRACATTSNAKFRFVDLFSGIGGMRIAFESAGGLCVASCEWNKYARQTYAANFPIAAHPFYGDICEVTKNDASMLRIPDHDVLVAGFPCQPFSIAGVSKKNALGNPHGFACDAQGTLFFELAKIIRIKKPKAFLLENVKNLVNHAGGITFKVIMDVLRRELGYWVDYRVLDAKGFVPQHRERTIIVGFQREVGFSWDDVRIPSPEQGPKIGTILHSKDDEADGRFVVGPHGKVNPKYTLTPHLWSYLKNYAEKHRAAGNGFGFGLVDSKSVARTLSARYYKDGSEILVSQGPTKPPRRLTPRECARLMGFDNQDRTFRIEVSDMQAYKQFGNSVVVPVIQAVAHAMLAPMLELEQTADEPRLPLLRRQRIAIGEAYG
ncbi:DNA (cytosine-5-)-methyltransferase [Reyranella sp.]|uniref:DNA (cytosine-5-)-methyltransferase n=1 Tax=Reyranella sp. TaxID=1929291 RepID=UPI003D0C8DAA